MLTIGQLAAQIGVSTKAVRVYHAKGLLPEPERDSAGYRRYDAHAIIDLARIVTLAQAGVPLARIPEVLHAGPEGSERAINRIDDELGAHIRTLQQRRTRLRHLGHPERLCLPPDGIEFMDTLRRIGLSEPHERAIRDGLVLSYALAPDLTSTIVTSRTGLLDDEEYVAVLRGYDQALTWEPDDPQVGVLAERAARLALRMPMPSDLPAFHNLPAPAMELLTGHGGLDCPTWQRLDALISGRVIELTT